MNEDLNNTNGLDEVFSNSYNQSRKKTFNKFLNIKKKYNSGFNNDNIEIFEKNRDTYSSDECDSNSSESDLDDSSESFFHNTKKRNRHRQNFFKTKKTYINIDSNNRNKKTIFTKIDSFNLVDNPFTSKFNSNIITISGKNPFKIDDEQKTQIIFQNISKNDNYTLFGINRDYLEYDSENLNTIYTVNKVYFDDKSSEISTSFTIKLPNIYNSSPIKTAKFGGNNIICTIISKIEFGYPRPSHYKITLDKSYSNIASVRLISSEIPNTAYTINSNYFETSFDGNLLKTNINNKLMWINEDEYIDTYNVRLYSDEIYFNSINRDTLFTYSDLTQTTKKKEEYSKKVWNKIRLNDDLLESLSNISNISSEYYDNNSNKDFFSPIKLTLESNFRHPDTGIILPATSNPTNGKYWLGNSYHNFQKSFIYDLDSIIVKNIGCSIENTSKDLNENINKMKLKKPYFHYYYTSLLKRDKNIDIDLENVLTYKIIDNIGIPKYLGYFIYDLHKVEGINIQNQSLEFVEISDLESEYIYPSISNFTEKIISPVLFPKEDEKDIGLSLKNFRRYPIHNVFLKDGKYTQKQFIVELKNKLNSSLVKIFNYKEQKFNTNRYNISNNYSKYPIKYFNINISNNSNKIDIRQYKLMDYFKSNLLDNIVFYNESIPYVILKSNGHTLETGDKILIEGFKSKDGIKENNVNGERMVLNFPSYKMFLRIIYPLPNLNYLDQEKYFQNLIGESINLNNISDELSFKRDLRKFSIKSDSITGNETYLNTKKNSYFGNYQGRGNFNNTQGNSDHSNKENYPLKTKGDNKSRFYGDFNNLAEYKFGIFSEEKDSLNSNIVFNPPIPKSLSNMDDGSLLHKLDNLDKFENRLQTNTLQTNMNYFGSKLVNSVNNTFLYPENNTQFTVNEIETKGVEINILENELFIKLSDINNIDDDTILGRINHIHNNGNSLNTGNFEVNFDLLSNSKTGNFNMGDIIYCLESNSIAMIVPETWDYDGLPVNPVILNGLGSYLIEKFKNNYTFLNNLVKKSKRGYYEDILKFTNYLNFWELERVTNSEKNIYISIPDIPTRSRLGGITTKNLKIYTPIKYKFLFNDDQHPNNILNLSEQDFSFSQSNTIKYDINTIKNSYLLGINRNSKSNYLVIETNNVHNFQKGDKIYIEKHNILNKYRNNLQKKILDIKNIKPFRGYLSDVKTIFLNLDNQFKTEEDKLVPYKNINLIYDYHLKVFKYSLGNEYFSSSYVNKKAYESFSDDNLYKLGIRDRLINWFFDNPFTWNSNNLEKTMKFYDTYMPSLENKKVIIKLIVSPFDSFGRTFLSEKESDYASKNGKSFTEVFLKEGPFYSLENSNLLEFNRSSKNVLPFLPGMGVYSWLEYDNETNQTYQSDKPTLLGKVLDTSILSMKDYIDNYNVLSYIHMFPQPSDVNEKKIANNLFNGSNRVSGIDYSVESVEITNGGNNYSNFTRVIFPDPYGFDQTGNTLNYNLSDELKVSIDFNNRQIIIQPAQIDLKNNIEKLDNIIITIFDENDSNITTQLLNSTELTVTTNIYEINNTSVIEFVESNIGSGLIELNSGKISLDIFYNHINKGKKAEGIPIIEEGRIIGVQITESGGGYILDGIKNINNSYQDINVTFSDIEGGGSGASGTINLSRSAPTYAIYLELNENIFKINNGVPDGFKSEMMELFKRGNNIFFNTQYFKGNGEFEESGFELNTDKVVNKDMSEKDYQSYGNYYLKNRTAAATIYQGYLTYEKQDKQELIHNQADQLIFKYGESTSGLRILDDNEDSKWYYFISEANAYHKLYLKTEHDNFLIHLYKSNDLVNPIYTLNSYIYYSNYIIPSNKLEVNKIYYIEIQGYKNVPYELFVDYAFDYDYFNLNDELDYVDISKYFSNSSNKKALGNIELSGLSLGFYGDIDIFKFTSEITTQACIILDGDIDSLSIEILSSRNKYILSQIEDGNSVKFNVESGEEYFIKVFSKKDIIEKSNNYSIKGIITPSPSHTENFTNSYESTQSPVQSENTYYIENQNKNDKYFVSGHLEYFYQNFLQNKCVINYSQPFSKEEEIYLNKHQIPILNRKLEINQDNNVNDNNTINYSNKSFVNFQNRITEYNPETYSIHSFSSFDNVFLYNNNKFKGIYTDPSSQNINSIGNLQKNDKDEIITESTGILDGNYSVLIPLWNGEYNNTLLFEQINSNKNILIDLEFSDEIEKGFMNNGKIRALGQQSKICGFNSSYYNFSITQDLLLENHFNLVNSQEYNKRGSKFILLSNGIDTYHSSNELISRNDVIIIGATIYGKNDQYPSQDRKRNVSSISELSTVKNISYLDNGDIWIELYSKLLNNHSSDEIVISRYKFAELSSNVFQNCSKFQVYVKKNIYLASKNQNNLTNEEFYSEYISKGDIICFDWCQQRYINYNTASLPPYEIITCQDSNICKENYKYTTQFNRILDVDYDTYEDNILITLEYTPFIYYNTGSTFIIFKKSNPKNGELQHNQFITSSSSGTDSNIKNSIKYNNLSTQPFIVDNKWYTKIFYQGNNCLTPTYKYLGEHKHLSNNKKNSWITGTKAYNTLSSRKVYIRGMKGINLPKIPLPSKSNNYNNNIYTNSEILLNTNDAILENIIYSIEQVTPVNDGEYILEPPLKSDFNSFYPLESLSINGQFSYNYEIFDRYNNEDISIDNIISSYKNGDNSVIWNDITVNSPDEYLEYNCIVIKGLYLGYGGLIEERTTENLNIVNSVDGYSVLDVQQEAERNKLIIDLEEENLNLNLPNNFIINKGTNRTEFINPESLSSIQYNNLNNSIFNNNIKIGQGGEIFKRKINIPLKLNKADYLFLCSPQLTNIKNNNSTITDTIFSKVLLKGETNKIMFNTFVSGLKEFDINVLPELSEIEFAFTTNNGELFDFNGLEHSFTIEIVELSQQIDKFNSISGLIS